MPTPKIQKSKRKLSGKTTRCLAAILFTDIEGYTALMQEDEQQAIAKLNLFREIIQNNVKPFGGEIIQYYGDGCLLLFSNSLDAVEFAKKIQETFRQEPPVKVRVGIHVGDVVLKDKFVFGDNVNLASRIESLGVGGSVLFSQTVRNQIVNQSSLNIVPLGSFHFKNVNEPMELFALANDGFPIPVPEEMEGKLKTNPPKDLVMEPEKKYKAKLGSLSGLILLLAGGWYFFLRPIISSGEPHWENSIAILPFDNLNNDTQKEYLSIGIADEIRAELTAIPKLKVISRSTCMYYREKDYPLPQIGKELKAAYILEGTVQHMNDDLKISLQLSNTSTDQVEWSPVFSRKMDDIFSIQEEIALEVANKLKLDLSEKEKAALRQRYTLSSTTYELYLKAMNSISLMTSEGIETGESLLGDVITLAEGYPVAYASMAWVTLFANTENSLPQDSIKKIAVYYVDQAKKIDPDMPQLHSVQAALDFYFDWEIESAEKEARNSIESGDPQGYLLLIDILMRTNQFREAAVILDKALEVDPANALLLARYGHLFIRRGKPESATNYFTKAITYDSLLELAHLGQATIHINADKYTDALAILNGQANTTKYRSPANQSLSAIAYYHLGENENAIRMLKDLDIEWEKREGDGVAFSLARAYAGMGMTEKALRWLNTSFKTHEAAMMDLLYDPYLEPLHEEKGYKDLLDSTGLQKYRNRK